MFPHKSLSSYSVVSGAAIAIALLLGVMGSAQVLAAGPYDGTWQGSSAAQRGYCQGAFTLTIVDGKVTGTRQSATITNKIVGTVDPDGTFHGTVSGLPVTGKFNQNSFSGSYTYQPCPGGNVSMTAHRG